VLQFAGSTGRHSDIYGVPADINTAPNKQFLQPALLYRPKQQLLAGQVDTLHTLRQDLARHFWCYHHDIRAFGLLVVLRGQPICPVLEGQAALHQIEIMFRKTLGAQ